MYIWAWQAAPLQPAGLDLFHDCGRRGHGQPAAAVLFRNKRGEKTGLGQRGDEFFRIGALAIEAAPIFAGKTRAQCPHRFTDRGKVVVRSGRRGHLMRDRNFALRMILSENRSPLFVIMR